MRKKIVRAGGNGASFQEASEDLRELAELKVPKSQVLRVTQETGDELAAARDTRVAQHRRGELQPETKQPPVPIACVGTDGGRMFTRAGGAGRGVHEARWKEDKIGCLWRMQGKTYEEDPHPKLPRCFQDENHVRKLVRGLHGSAGPPPDDTDAEDEERTDEVSQETNVSTPRWQPERVFRTCVATLQDIHAFGWQVAAEAQRRGFHQAERRVFLGDGAHENWTVQKTHFPHFTPILDFVHLIGHLFDAAKAVTGSYAARWEQYIDWATACWQGRGERVTEELERWQQTLGEPPADAADDDPREVVRLMIGYLQNNRERIDYPAYRRQGLPITTALVESLIKQFNRRVKGTDKFWNRPVGAEAILQVKAALLSDGDPLQDHLTHLRQFDFRTIVPEACYANARGLWHYRFVFSFVALRLTLAGGVMIPAPRRLLAGPCRRRLGWPCGR